MNKLVFAFAIALCACGGPAASAPDAGPVYVANNASFATFSEWESFDGGTGAVGDTLDGGQRILYLNQRPPHGSAEFPVGTIIVKTTVGAPIFAMVKVGGGFNSAGAKDWEWFELTPNTTGGGTIQWGGTTAPLTDPYAQGPISCNQCHMAASDNDFVAGPIQLSAF